MPFCPKCGAEYQTGTKFCGKCGGNLDGSVAPVPVANQGPTFFQKILDTKDVTATMNPSDIQANKVLAILAYCACFAYILFASWFGLGFFGLLVAAGLLVAPCIVAAKSPFVSYHIGQSLTALFGIMIVGIVESAVSSFFFKLIAANSLYDYLSSYRDGISATVVIGTIVAWFIHIVFMAIPILVVLAGVINTGKGKAKALPLIGKIGFTFDK